MRVVGFPGETIRMTDGLLRIADEAVELVSLGANEGDMESAGELQRETLPGGVSYIVLNMQDGSIGDDTQAFTVPEGHVFVLGDNRDNAAGGRFTTVFVPIDALIGRAQSIFWNDKGRSIVGRKSVLPDRLTEGEL